MRRLLFLFIVASVLFACTSIDCPVQNTVRSHYTLKTASAVTDTLKDTLTVVSHRMDGTDTILLNSSIGVTVLSLPVGTVTPEDTLFFRFRNGTYSATDTVWIKKENYPHFESVDCNAAFFHTLTDVHFTNHAIDSIVIKNRYVSYDPYAEHFYLYIKKRS